MMDKHTYDITNDGTQQLLVKTIKKLCRHLTLGSLFKVMKAAEKCCDNICPEWRELDRW